MSFSRRSDKLTQSLDSIFEQNLGEWKKIYPGIREIEISDKQFLYRQGDCSTGFFWIRQGIVKLSYLTQQGSELTLTLLTRGDIFGRLQHDEDYRLVEESAQALGDVICYCIGLKDFKQLILNRPDLSWLILESINDRQRRTEQKLRMILTQPVEQRIVATLRELAQLFGARCTHGFSLEVFLTQQELADLVGASRSVVSTIMNNFRSRGLLDYTREQICINDSAFSDSFFDND